MTPGRALHRLATRICSAKVLERVIEPAIADLQREHADGAHQPRSKRIAILLAGYLAVLEVIVMTAIDKPIAVDEGRVLLRTFAWAIGVTCCACALIILLTVLALPGMPPYYIALMTPMMLPIAMPIGLVLGIAFALSGRMISPRVRNAVLIGAFVVAVVSYGTMTWGIAMASQTFRQSMSRAVGADTIVPKGLHEMSVSEAQRDRALAPGGDPMAWPRRQAWTYHVQLAMSFAAPAVAFLALALIGRGARWAVVMGACGGVLRPAYRRRIACAAWSAASCRCMDAEHHLRVNCVHDVGDS